MSIETTNRGFEKVTFTDRSGVECSLQQSSAIDMDSDDGIEHPGSSFVWLGCNDADPKVFVPNGDPSWRSVPMPENYIANTRMHLSRDHARMLIGYLTSWLNDGSFIAADDDVLNESEIE